MSGLDFVSRAQGPVTVTPENAAVIGANVKMRHFKPDELELARRFVREAILTGDYFFDVLLETPLSRDAATRVSGLAATVYMNRIDAVVVRPSDVWIIEFKNKLTYSGIGELLGYEMLYSQQFRPQKPLKLAYVADKTFPDRDDLHGLLSAHGIMLWRV